MATVSATQIIRLKNKTDDEQEVWLEPLGDRVALRPDVLYELSASSDFGKVEIDLSNHGFVVYGWVTRIDSIDATGNLHLEWQLPGNP